MILVTGAGGFVGRHVVKALLDRGCKIRCLVRSTDAAVNLLPDPVDIVVGNVNDKKSLIEACQNVSAVIHLIAVIREIGEDTFELINVEGTRNLVEAAENSGVSQFLHLSALGACDNPVYKYAYSKWQGEEFVKNSKLNWVILRPSVIYGEGFGFMDRMLQSVNMTPPWVPVPGRGKTLFQPISVHDLVNCIIKALINDVYWKKVYEIGGPEHLNYRQILDILLEHLELKRIKVYIPTIILQIVVPIIQCFLKDPPVTPVELKQMKLSNVTDPDAVEKYFGFQPVQLREGIKYLPKTKPTNR
ncbi:NAD-dependent epimerase/dehydratase [Desulfofarcimen acetoxidans DSM 771]|uniref:NAD-dependent epimerase/dehydratase n=1 Tax=Desulfofarcimen acetoxidans (strain ATCC 49208 / DSM 771 / KCTC 5769 / VKM B-1644 / 5575) TaxID=485916 RepID=C8W6A7_DESAS|nr:complex I NDUFA9 subunit family protein [Desulfofarcimen acetoxidans]ACV62196.1 NAD-dependent epimerase/dehydratase [Desulfofarcimen acetoxidans DSM 771]